MKLGDSILREKTKQVEAEQLVLVGKLGQFGAEKNKLSDENPKSKSQSKPEVKVVALELRQITLKRGIVLRLNRVEGPNFEDIASDK